MAFTKLDGKTSDIEVIETLQTVCEVDRLQTYKFPPMDMWKACNAFKEGWEEELEKVLTKTTNKSDLFQTQNEFCGKSFSEDQTMLTVNDDSRTKACSNVKMSDYLPYLDKMKEVK